MMELIYFIIFVNLCNYVLAETEDGHVNKNNTFTKKTDDGNLKPWKGNKESFDEKRIHLEKPIKESDCLNNQFNDEILKLEERNKEANYNDNNTDISANANSTRTLIKDRNKRKREEKHEQIIEYYDAKNRLSHNIRSGNLMEQNVNALSQFLTSKPLINVPNYCENKEPVLFCNSPREKQINYYNSKKKNDLQYANEFRSIASNYNNTPTKTQSELRKKYLELLFPEQNHLNRKQYFYNDLMQNTPINDIKRVNNYSQGIYTNAFRNLERFNNKGSPMEFYSNRTVNALPNNQFHLLRSTMIPSLISYENKNYSKQVNHCPEVHNEPKSHKKISCGPVSICHPSGGLPKCPKPALAPDPKNYQYSQFLTGEITERIVKKILEKAKSNMLPELGIGSKNFSQIRTNNYINITMCGGPCSPIYGEPKKFLSWLVITNLRRKPRLTNYYNIKPERNFLFDHKFLNPWPENVKRDVIAMPQSLFGFQQQPMYGFGDEPYTSKLFYDSSRPEKNNKFIYRSKIVLFPE